MKAFKDLFRDVSGAEYAMAAAIVIAFVVIAAGAGLRSTSNSRESAVLRPQPLPRLSRATRLNWTPALPAPPIT